MSKKPLKKTYTPRKGGSRVLPAPENGKKAKTRKRAKAEDKQQGGPDNAG